MVGVTESLGSKGEFAATLAAGVNLLDNAAQVSFQPYRRVVLPLDGFIFWIKSGPALVVSGSLHYGTQRQQNEDETPGINSIIFTSLSQVTNLNDIAPDVLYLATLPSGVQYAFSNKAPYYRQANAWHYTGTAVLPALRSQIIDNEADFDAVSLVVSNSLPMWLALNSYKPPYPGFTTNVSGVALTGGKFINAGVMLYPSFAVPDNLTPPYGVVHIEPGKTDSLQASPIFDPTLSQDQLAVDDVRVTIYALRNAAIMTFLAAVGQYSFDTDALGIMNMPVVHDEKRPQAEMAVLAMKKTIAFQVCYSQGTSRSVARQLIESVVTTYLPQPLTAAAFEPPSPS